MQKEIKKNKNEWKHVSIDEKIKQAARMSENELMKSYQSSMHGLTPEGVKNSEELFGANTLSYGKKESTLKKLISAFVNPFTAILFVLALVSFVTDVLMQEAGEKNLMTVIIIFVLVLISGILRFIQETRSGNAAERLLKMIKTTTCIERQEEGKNEIPLEDVLVGDIVHLSAGDMIPADIRFLVTKDLFVSQSSLTGESEPVEKTHLPLAKNLLASEIVTYPNIGLMGTNVISGTASALVIVHGDDTIFGRLAKELDGKEIETSFEKGVNSVSWVLIRFMLIMVPVVFFLNGITKGDWMQALMFAISVAVGLTPEMLPMIITTCLAKGAVSMSKEKTIIKNLNSIQNLGSINILCTDKTGTLTQDKIVLEYHMDIHGNEDLRVLRHAFLNSYYQTGLKNLLDVAIIQKFKEEGEINLQLREAAHLYKKIDEIPFDFERRRMSVVVEDRNKKTQMITKGAIEEMLSICSHAEYRGEVLQLEDHIKRYILEKVDEFNEDGMRVIGVAQKTNPSPVGDFSVADETNMVFIGYLAFLDPPKESAQKAIKALEKKGLHIKILTGDNEKVTQCVCKQVGIDSKNILLGNQISEMKDEEIAAAAEKTNVFAKLSPTEKSRIIRILREDGNVVGYMGDGINDAPAMKASDVGISVDNAVDIAKESADVILLEKDLMVLEKGILEGRKTYVNMIKYIKMTASSNFGNMFSVLAASAFLPFMPMRSIHLILLNLIYDLSCTAIPWDHVDEELLTTAKKWDANSIGKFMLWFGPTSSIFDIITYLVLYFIICPAISGGPYHQLSLANQAIFIGIFQAGWFVESMWTQSLVIHLIRTDKIPFIQSRPSFQLFFLTFSGILLLTWIPFTKFGLSIGLLPVPAIYFYWLFAIVCMYTVLVSVFKKMYVKKMGDLL